MYCKMEFLVDGLKKYIMLELFIALLTNALPRANGKV